MALTAFVAACAQSQPQPDTGSGAQEHPDTSESTDDSAVDSAFDSDSSSGSEEFCDGLDNDGDGLVDEGSADLDGDGVFDCSDDACEASAVALPVEGAGACDTTAEPAADPWAVETMWSLELSGDADGCWINAVVDLDGDGGGDILCMNRIYDPGTLMALSGADGSLLWRSDAFDTDAALAVGDVDLDGVVDIVGLSAEGYITAITADGTALWTSTVDLGNNHATDNGVGGYLEQGTIQVFDIDRDGAPEVLNHHGIVRGADGQFLSYLNQDYDYYNGWSELAVADIDLDNETDIFFRYQRLKPDGSVVWEGSFSSDEEWGVVPLLVQADEDPEGEIVWLTSHTAYLYESDGALVHSFALPESGGLDASSWTCAGDLDGDGDVELVVPGPDELNALHLDGSVLWTQELDEPSDGISGCTLFDFDLDGKKDVVFGDYSNLYIFDGADGTIRFRDDTWYSLTSGEFPLVVDLDGDGSVEIVAPVYFSSLGPLALRVYSHAEGAWPPGSTIWGSSNWSGVTHRPDGAVVAEPAPPWLAYNAWRAQPEVLEESADLQLRLVDTCASSCDPSVAQVQVTVQVENLGPGLGPGSAGLAVFLVEEDGSMSQHDWTALAPWLADDASDTPFTFSFSLEQAQRGVVFVAGSDGAGGFVDGECDTSNNTLSWQYEGCDEGRR